MWLGVDYYPEQWNINMLEEDLKNIKEMGSNVIRIGEFAWHLMEREEGKYDFSFFDYVIEKAREYDLKIIFGTPTATIPAWLIKKYPDMLLEYEPGRKISYGGRHTNCYNHPMFEKYANNITIKLVEHYKDEKNIIAWQMDNELGHEGSDLCYCDNCKKQFQNFLKKKYENIEELNIRYGTAFWSQTYNDFDEIPMPTKTIATHNPSLRMDWERFRSETIEKFLNSQIRIIREIIPDALILHDFAGGGMSKHVDYSKLAENLDIVAFNNYPVWGGQKDPIKPYEIAFALDYMRGLKRKNFWITEGIMGAQGHDITGYTPRPNQAKMWSYQGIARGAEALTYFRYRGGIKGAEQFCYGILDADNKKRRKYHEVKSFFSDIKKYKDILEEPLNSEIAIVHDFQSLASFRIQQQSLLLNCEEETKKYYKYFYDRNIYVDVIPSSLDLKKYKIIILPFLTVQDDEFRKKVESYVKEGGILILTYRTSVKDIDNNLVLNEFLPVGYNKMAGLYVEEIESLQDYDCLKLVGENEYNGVEGKGGIFREMLVCTTAKTLFKYSDKFYNEFSAVTKNKLEKGKVYYLGCGLEEKLIHVIFDDILEEVKIKSNLTIEGLEVIERGNDKKIRFYINHNDFPVTYQNLSLDPFECRIEEI